LLQSPAEVPKVRRALLWAAGQLKLPELADPVAQSLSDPDAGVRLAAIKALGQTATNFDHQRQLSELLDPVGQPATEIGDAAWAVLSELFKLAPNPQLVPYAVRFKAPAKAEPTIVRDTAARRLVVLRILRDRAKGANDAEELAGYEQQIGDAAIDAQRYDEAISSLRNALQIAIQRSNGPREELVSDALMKALLRGRKFTEAITFYQTQARRDLRFQGSLSAAIRQEAERLYSDTKDLDAAKQLIAMALASTPPLPDNQREMLENLEKTINNRTREQNQTPRYPKLPVNASIN
jgi:tetratricopeptide (TPR) repeat protein